MELEILATFLVAMFLFSGFTKVISMGKSEAHRLTNRYDTSETQSAIVVFLGGLWELIGALLVLYGVWYHQARSDEKPFVVLGCKLLALFTVAATLMFYTYPFKQLPFLSNMTSIAGLLLLAKVYE